MDQNDLVNIFFMTQKSSKIPDFDVHKLKYGTTGILFVSTYTAKQLKKCIIL